MSAPQHTSWEHKHTNKKKIKLEAIEEGIQHWPLPPHAFKPEHIPTRIPYTRTGSSWSEWWPALSEAVCIPICPFIALGFTDGLKSL